MPGPLDPASVRSRGLYASALRRRHRRMLLFRELMLAFAIQRLIMGDDGEAIRSPLGVAGGESLIAHGPCSSTTNANKTSNTTNSITGGQYNCYW